MLRNYFLGLVSLVLFPCVAFALDGVKEERVEFEGGTRNATIEASITGYETIDYLVKAEEGEPLRVELKSSNRANYFNLLSPKEDYVAFFNGSSSDPLNEFSGKAPASGDLKVRVYLMRSAARRNESAKFTLKIESENDKEN